MLLEREDQPLDGFPQHDAVGVQDQHEIVAVAVLIQEVHDVAGLEIRAVGPSHQEQAPHGVAVEPELGQQFLDDAFLLAADFGIGAVA